jgi:BMFP domain-containing protein YqiC
MSGIFPIGAGALSNYRSLPALRSRIDSSLCREREGDEMSERDTPRTESAYLIASSLARSRERLNHMAQFSRELEAESARLQARVTELEARYTKGDLPDGDLLDRIAELEAKLAKAQHQCVGSCFK